MDNGTLFVVATPIGNLEDLSPRARQVLERVDLIAAEDTRRTGRLLSHFGIKASQIALHDHNEEITVSKLICTLKEGKSVALVSDAGTPLISDPGFRLVRAAHAETIPVSPIPGASAVTAALSVAGLACDRFCFEGFLSNKKTARTRRLRELRGETRTIVFYESVHRISDTIRDLNEVLGPARNAFVGRELSKLHEQCVSATLGDLQEMLAAERITLKGEFVVVVEGNRSPDTETAAISVSRLIAEASAVLPAGQVADLVSSLTGRRRNEVYRLVLAGKSDLGHPD
ncbi:MAG: 16S rRNA (cytidine(1402)-2'-O)-methyltransferase [Woeseiaceae bacterium]